VIEDVQLVAYLAGRDLPALDPRVSPCEEPEVWFVRFTGQVSMNLLGERHGGIGEGYFLIHPVSGVYVQVGVLALAER
jgi:hypothetical protein